MSTSHISLENMHTRSMSPSQNGKMAKDIYGSIYCLRPENGASGGSKPKLSQTKSGENRNPRNFAKDSQNTAQFSRCASKKRCRLWVTLKLWTTKPSQKRTTTTRKYSRCMYAKTPSGVCYVREENNASTTLERDNTNGRK